MILLLLHSGLSLEVLIVIQLALSFYVDQHLNHNFNYRHETQFYCNCKLRFWWITDAGLWFVLHPRIDPLFFIWSWYSPFRPVI